MAKQTTGYLGGFSGKLGPAVGYMWNGKWCLRAHQPMVHNPRTAAQTAHRTMFKQEVQLAARMRWAVVTSLTDAARDAGMTSYNLFVSLNQPAFSFEDNQLSIDWRRLQLSLGDVAPVADASATREDGNVLSVSFDRGHGAAYDHVYLYVYAPDLEQGFLSAPAYRREKRVRLALPDTFAGCELHAYLMVRHDDGRWSPTLYVPCPDADESHPQPAAAPEKNSHEILQNKPQSLHDETIHTPYNLDAQRVVHTRASIVQGEDFPAGRALGERDVRVADDGGGGRGHSA